MSDDLITKYRPLGFAGVIGQASVVRSLAKVIGDRTSHTFLFAGPPGTGKTTIARLTAEMLGCWPTDLIEIDAASNTGIDDMRSVASTLMYKPLGEGKAKVVIVDECQALSKAAIQSLLKITEEPPPWCFWMFCTTDLAKLPEALRSRCSKYELKPVGFDDLAELLFKVANEEGLKLDGKIIDLCAAEANGSPRQALSNLGVCAGAKDYKDAAELLRSAEASEEAINLARALAKGASWGELQKVLSKMNDINPESVRHVVRAYFIKLTLGAKTEQAAGRGIEVLDAFSTPFYSSDGLAPLIIACGKATLQ